MLNILVPTDFSENAFNAIRYAMELFKYEKCEFLVVNAFADDVYENTLELTRDFFEEYKEKSREATERALQKVVAEMLRISPNPRHNYEYKAVFASLVDAVNEQSNELNVDVVVMGTKGKTDARDITFGSQTLQVIKYVKCPVLAIPTTYRGDGPERIVFPTDYQIPYKRRELKLVNTLVRNFKSTIQFLHISKSEKLSHRQQDNRQFLEESIPSGQDTFINTDNYDIEKAVNYFVQTEKSDLLVMVNNRHSYMESLLYSSTIERLGLKIEIPFLVLQNLSR